MAILIMALAVLLLPVAFIVLIATGHIGIALLFIIVMVCLGAVLG